MVAIFAIQMRKESKDHITCHFSKIMIRTEEFI